MNGSAAQPKQWLIFCRVIDNFGDAGVCWRLSRALALRGYSVQLFIDQPEVLAWMAPEQERPTEIRIWDWNPLTPPPDLDKATIYGVIEAFACEIPVWAKRIMEDLQAANRAALWLNLEYLSAQDYVERCHLLPSPQPNGLTKYFFYPGFTPRTGGLLALESPHLLTASNQSPAQSAEIRCRYIKQALSTTPIDSRLNTDMEEPMALANEFWLCMFCYDNPRALAAIQRIQACLPSAQVLRVFVPYGEGATSIHRNLSRQPWPFSQQVRMHFLSPMSQRQFDSLLDTCNMLFVRGEDSLAQALWRRCPIVWQIYPQEDGAHVAKLEAFLDWAKADNESRAWHRWWNAIDSRLYLADFEGTACSQLEHPAAPASGMKGASAFDDVAPMCLPSLFAKEQINRIPNLIEALLIWADSKVGR